MAYGRVQEPVCEGTRALKIYCDTCSLRHNVDEEKERVALERLAEKFPMFGSHLVRHEAANTKKTNPKGDFLIVDADALELVPKEKVLLGFQYLSDQYGGFFAGPLTSDVPDETIRNEVMKRGLKQRDAEHVTLAICNSCNVLLTFDKKILKIGTWLEERFKLKAWRPSQLLEAIDP
jgi:hypothetical protein